MENIKIVEKPKTLEEYILKRVNDLEECLNYKDQIIHELERQNHELSRNMENTGDEFLKLVGFIKRRFKKEIYGTYSRLKCDYLDDDVDDTEDDFYLILKYLRDKDE